MTQELIEYCKEFWLRPKMDFRALMKSPFRETFLELSERLNSKNSSQILWHILNDTHDVPKCRCGTDTKYNNSIKNYSQYCSKDCGYADPQRQQRIQDTMMKKYGVANAAHSPEFSEKKKSTNLKNLGVDHPSKSQKVKDKKNQTMLTNWGVTNPSQHPDIQAAKIATNQNKYGVDWPSQNSDILDKQRATNLSRHGVKWTMQSNQVKNKAVQTLISRYGVSHPQQHAAIRAKTQQTNLQRYGNINVCIADSIIAKKHATNLEKYGVDEIFKLESHQQKMKDIIRKKYGVNNVMELDWVKEKITQTNIKNWGVPSNNYRHLTSDVVSILQNKELFELVATGKTAFELCKLLNVTASTIYKRAASWNIDIIRPSISSYEMIIQDILKNLNASFLKNDRKTLNGLELDFHLVEHKLAIEVGSKYWHSDSKGSRDKYYHKLKLDSTNSMGIELLQFFDDDVLEPSLIQDCVSRHLNKDKIPKLIGLKLEPINHDVAREFLRIHLLNYNETNSDYYLALIDAEGNVLFACGLTEKENCIEINNWWSDPNVSTNMILYHCFRELIEFKPLELISDDCYGYQKIYQTLGFKKKKQEYPREFKINEIESFWDAGHTLWKLEV
jgi:hypothetical protein